MEMLREFYQEFSKLVDQTNDLKKIYQIAEKLTPRKNNRNYFQSLMDLANIVCKSKVPNCVLCPVKKYCLTTGNIILEEKKKS